MSQQPDTLQMEPKPSSKGKAVITVRLRDEIVYADELKPASDTQRKRFIEALRVKVPSADATEIDTELLRIADALSRPRSDPAPASDLAELEMSRIVRPELFITPMVTGMSMPVLLSDADKPVPRWMTYLRWADGRRERRELTNVLNLADDTKLWIHPTPSTPSMTMSAGWSRKGRRTWLDGAPAPDPAELFRRLCERIAYFIDLPTEVAAGATATLALWVMLSYVFPAWDAIPYLYVGGPLNSGKSTLFRILERLVFRALMSSNLTGPALFRTLHDRGGVLLFDEAERLRQSTPETGEILSMLLAGYKRGGQATRLEAVGDTFKTVSFDVFGLKALACIAGLPPALLSRSICVAMFRAAPDSPKPRRRIDADPDGWKTLRDDLHSLALEHGAAWLSLANDASVCPSGFDGRSFELWQPLLALAKWIESYGAESLLARMQRYALDSIDTTKDDQVPDADEILLEILTEFVRDGYDPTPSEVLEKAQERDASIFGRPGGNGPRWQPGGVTRHLKAYGIPKPKKSNGVRRYRVSLEVLRRIQTNYRIDLGLSLADPPNGSAQRLATKVLPNGQGQ